MDSSLCFDTYSAPVSAFAVSTGGFGRELCVLAVGDEVQTMICVT